VVRCEREETEEVLPRDADSGVERSAPIHDRPWEWLSCEMRGTAAPLSGALLRKSARGG